MLILNGTKAFADLMQDVLGDPPNKKLTDDPATDMQWVCHSIKIKRKNCVIAMEVDSRYSMIFIDVKKVDSKQFIQQFIMRLATEMSFMYAHPLESFERNVKAIVEQHPKALICQRGDRSVQSHLNDVVWHLKNQIEETGELPSKAGEWINFGVFVNKLLRKTKGMKDFFYPYERMKEQWEKSLPKLLKETEAEIDFKKILDERSKIMISGVDYGNKTLH